MHRRATLLVILLVAPGCTAAAAEDPEALGDVAATRDELVTHRAGRDVAVLQASIGQTVGRVFDSGFQLGDLVLDLSRCAGDDCSDAAQNVLDGALVGRFIYDARLSGHCETVEVQTAIRDDAFDAPTFKGIGFHFSPSPGGEAFVSKEVLEARAAFGHAKLKDGSNVLVHRFVMRGVCFGMGGSGGALDKRSYEFKPYAQFDVVSTDTSYRIWDAVSKNYHLGRNQDGSWTASFDRRRRVLQ